MSSSNKSNGRRPLNGSGSSSTPGRNGRVGGDADSAFRTFFASLSQADIAQLEQQLLTSSASPAHSSDAVPLSTEEASRRQQQRREESGNAMYHQLCPRYPQLHEEGLNDLAAAWTQALSLYTGRIGHAPNQQQPFPFALTNTFVDNVLRECRLSAHTAGPAAIHGPSKQTLDTATTSTATPSSSSSSPLRLALVRLCVSALLDTIPPLLRSLHTSGSSASSQGMTAASPLWVSSLLSSWKTEQEMAAAAEEEKEQAAQVPHFVSQEPSGHADEADEGDPANYDPDDFVDGADPSSDEEEEDCDADPFEALNRASHAAAPQNAPVEPLTIIQTHRKVAALIQLCWHHDLFSASASASTNTNLWDACKVTETLLAALDAASEHAAAMQPDVPAAPPQGLNEATEMSPAQSAAQLVSLIRQAIYYLFRDHMIHHPASIPTLLPLCLSRLLHLHQLVDEDQHASSAQLSPLELERNQLLAVLLVTQLCAASHDRKDGRMAPSAAPQRSTAAAASMTFQQPPLVFLWNFIDENINWFAKRLQALATAIHTELSSAAAAPPSESTGHGRLTAATLASNPLAAATCEVLGSLSSLCAVFRFFVTQESVLFPKTTSLSAVPTVIKHGGFDMLLQLSFAPVSRTVPLIVYPEMAAVRDVLICCAWASPAAATLMLNVSGLAGTNGLLLSPHFQTLYPSDAILFCMPLAAYSAPAAAAIRAEATPAVVHSEQKAPLKEPAGSRGKSSKTKLVAILIKDEADLPEKPVAASPAPTPAPPAPSTVSEKAAKRVIVKRPSASSSSEPVVSASTTAAIHAGDRASVDALTACATTTLQAMLSSSPFLLGPSPASSSSPSTAATLSQEIRALAMLQSLLSCLIELSAFPGARAILTFAPQSAMLPSAPALSSSSVFELLKRLRFAMTQQRPVHTADQPPSKRDEESKEMAAAVATDDGKSTAAEKLAAQIENRAARMRAILPLLKSLLLEQKKD